MAQKVRLADGRVIALQRDGDVWHITIDGRFYCATSVDTLVQGLSTVHHIVKPKSVTPEKHPRVIAHETLKSDRSSLIARQAARQDLKRLCSRGDEVAAQLIDQLNSKPAPSREAQNLIKRLGKHDFADVTHEELVQHVNNLVLRSKLILELADRLRLA